jgi:hypothetical protein
MSSLGFSSVSSNPAGAACFTSVNSHYASSGAPARMADGRIMTDFRPRCLQYAVAAAGAFGEQDARRRMTQNADELMMAAREMNNRKNTAVSCVDTMVPELYKRVCTWKGCKVIPGNFQGIGTGRIYIPSAENSAANPQALSDGMPAIPQTYARAAPQIPSSCAVNDAETAWSLHGPIERYGSSAKSHPYSAPRA